MDTSQVITEELRKRIRAMEELIKSAKDCLKDEDFLQCAVRLEEASNQGKFSELLINIFDSMSGN